MDWKLSAVPCVFELSMSLKDGHKLRITVYFLNFLSNIFSGISEVGGMATFVLTRRDHCSRRKSTEKAPQHFVGE